MSKNLQKEQTTHQDKKVSVALKAKINNADAILPKDQMIYPVNGRNPLYRTLDDLCKEKSAKIYLMKFSYDGKNTGVIRQDTEAKNSVKYRMYGKDDELYNTQIKDYVRQCSCKSAVPFVVGRKGELLVLDGAVTNKSSDVIRLYTKSHYFFERRKPIICAGMISIDNGRIVGINTTNSHYEVSKENLYNTVKLFEDVISKNAKISHEGKRYSKKSFIDMMEGKDSFSLGEVRNKIKNYLTTAVENCTSIVRYRGKNKYNVSGNINGSSNNPLLKDHVEGSYVQKITQAMVLENLENSVTHL
ncbi:hypothetical protein HL033_03100 [Neoehrlichia mikurensis]|uniref:Uncharacterized protein n=1 Tax=Neoehrlichia mikurensis TaxID=89586 RepID=A0A9Q9F3T1_9RICK|nr:hypothetical protein [Neoehrlichia mikurensis]QXK91734.1 hypothetical protein IAH97_03095 [Neoehrlichia mikurensis]QXK92946.1 hypothetical protein HUN61_03090 [Neoehrlichia mikurensis]QXK93424.1 hypothetical protein HL033_03100 [Neoehrlichia mikurensis]UTO55624.1 hypothetical protein LUA82_00850 [Neoehrlichia mikurensis]UTO56545.1 hypothetical protein LUA81_00850 [Neoehrlichia mikurensis]